MKLDRVKIGLRVITTKLDNPDGIFAKQKFIENRRSGVTGTVRGFLAGHGGDAWWILHDDGNYGVYWHTEFKIARKPRRTL